VVEQPPAGRLHEVEAEIVRALYWHLMLAAHPGATFHRYADLNHLMQPGVGKMTPDEFERPMRLSARFVDDVARWTMQASGSPAGAREHAR